MSDQQNSTLPEDQCRVLRELAWAVTSAQTGLTAQRPALPMEGDEDDSSPPWRQALDSIEFDRLPALAEDLADPALALGSAPRDPVLQLRMQKALQDLLAAAAATRDMLSPARSESGAAASALPGICRTILAAVAELLDATDGHLERALEQPSGTEPPEIHLLTGARLGRLQVEVAIAELQDGYLRFQNAIEQGTAPTDAQGVGS